MGATEAGEYKLIIYDKDDENAEFVLSELYFTVHPLETTWLENVTGTDWNAWENWSKGPPWTCTNVIILNPRKLIRFWKRMRQTAVTIFILNRTLR